MTTFKTLNLQGTYNGIDAALHGARHPLKSYRKFDSYWHNGAFVLGENDYNLLKNLTLASIKEGHGSHKKFLRMIPVWVDITADRGWWQEYATYKVGTCENSQSTMHTLMKDSPLSIEDFELPENFDNEITISEEFQQYINLLNTIKRCWSEADSNYWREYYTRVMKALLPESFKQTRTCYLNYEVLSNMYKQRKNHRLPQWNTDFVSWVESLPYSEFIIGKFD